MMELENALAPGLLAVLETFATCTVASRGPNQIIGRENDPYIERWYLARRATVPIGCDGSFADVAERMPSEIENIYLHRYARSDNEDMHCHPWPNGSLVLRGGYVEETPDGIFARRPGQIILRRAEQRHRIISIEPGTLSLFVTMPKEREWGFYPQGEFVPWRKFIETHQARGSAA